MRGKAEKIDPGDESGDRPGQGGKQSINNNMEFDYSIIETNTR